MVLLLGLVAGTAEAAVNANFTFAPSNPTAGQTIQFTDTSTGGPTNWQWDFNNDGITDSTARNPTWSFPSAGTYPVRLVALIPPADIGDIVKNVVVGSAGNPGSLSFTNNSYTVAEGGGTASISVRRTGGSSGAASVRCVSSNGTAVAPGDYTATNTVLSWPNGDSSNKTCSVPIINDAADEPNETVNLSLTNFSGASAGSPTSATLTITDDDDPPGPPGNLSFTSSTYSVNENGGVASIAIRRTNGSSGAVSVRCNTSGGTATAGNDYTNTADVLNWSNGDTSNKVCTVPINNDGVFEGNETVNLNLSNFTGGAGAGSPTTAVLTIQDDDTPPEPPGDLSFTSATYTVAENGGMASIAVRRTNGDGGAVSVRCVTSNGSASAGSDYSATNDLLEWADGDTANKTCTVPITNDSLDESNETVNLSLNSFTGGAGSGSPTSATLTITDNDEAGNLQFTSTAFQVDEDGGSASVTVSRTGGVDGAVSVRCVTSNGSAVAPGDYTSTNATLNWGNGQAGNRTCTIPIVDDSSPESDETVQLSLTGATGAASLGTPNSATLTIVDDDGNFGELRFTTTSYVVNENSVSASIAVARVGGADGAVSARCVSSNGTAIAGSDYTAINRLLQWADGDSANKSCLVPILADTVDENNETLRLDLTGFTGGVSQGSPNQATLTILDNDVGGTLQFTAASYSTTEGVGVANIAVRRVGGLDGTISVRCSTTDATATAPDDYTATADVLTWTHADTADKQCTVPIVDDVLDEADETITLTLSQYTGGAVAGAITTATLTVGDNDEAGDLRFVSGSATASEGVGTASIAVRRVGGSDGPVSVRCNTLDGSAVAPDDYAAQSDLLEWADGDTADKACTIPIVDDIFDEPNETVQLTLSDFTGGVGVGSPASALLTLTDNDEAGDLSFTAASYEVDEEDDLVATILVRRTGGSDGPVSVRCNTSDGTASAGGDYTATTEVLAWADGDAANKTCTVPIVDDEAAEPAETVQLSLSDFTGGATAGAPNAAVLTILSSDNPGQLSFTMATTSIAESGGVAAIAVQRTGDDDGAVSVECRTSDGTASAPGDYSATVDVLTWSEGDSADKLCTVPIVDDSDDESNETIQLTLAQGTDGVGLGAQSTATLTVIDDDDAGALRFSMASYQVDEAAGSASLAVQRTGGSSGEVSARCRSTDGTAVAPGDYTATNDLLTWTDGDTADKLCTVPILDDAIDESDEALTLSLTDRTGGVAAGTPSTATLTVIDDDDHGELSFVMASLSVLEDAGVAVIAVRRTGGSDGAVGAQCASADGTAVAASDYAATTDVLAWADGDSADKLCTVPIVDDSLDEADETVALSLSNATGGATLGTSNSTLTLVDDDDAGELSFAMATLDVEESAGSAQLAVQRTGGSDGPVSVECNSSDDTATEPGDYAATAAVLTWGNGEIAEKLCTVSIVGDTVDETDETILLALANPSGGAALGTIDSATITVLDDDAVGSLGFSMASYSADEGVGTASLTVERTGGSVGAASARCRALATGTAVDPDDYGHMDQTLTWIDGEAGDKTCTVTIVDDGVDEADETIDFELDMFSGASAGVTAASVTILDNDGAGSLQFTASAYQAGESDGTVDITVRRTGGSDGVVSVRCDTADGSATAPGDYGAQMATLGWADGESGDKICQVSIATDDVDEGDETVDLALTNLTGGATLGTPSTAVLTLVDDDAIGELGFTSVDYVVNENGVDAAITVARTGGSRGEVTVRCDTADGSAVAPGDYSQTMQVLTWANGSAGDRSCTVPIVDDSLDEIDETVDLLLTQVTGGASLGTSAATLTIEDDDASTLAFVATTEQVAEDAGSAALAVRRTGASDGAVSVRCETVAGGSASGGDDYLVTSQVLNWGAGETTDQLCHVPILDDAVDEGDETVTVQLSTATGDALLGVAVTATLTLLDDDSPGTIRFAAATSRVDESVGSVDITVERVGGSDGVVTARCETRDGSAAAPEDYQAAAMVLTWIDGESADKTCTVVVVDDMEDEGDETIDVVLSQLTGGASAGAPSTHTVTINDDDTAGSLSFAMTETTVDEAVGNAVVVVRRSGLADNAVTVLCSTTGSGSATAGTDYLATAQTLSWSAGDVADKMCLVPILDDSAVEGATPETLDLTLSVPTGGASLGAPSNAAVEITDNDSSGVFRFSMASYGVSESAGTAELVVQRTGGSDGMVSVRCDSTDGTATARSDYVSQMTTLTWSDGDSTDKLCIIPIVDDTAPEVAETILLALTLPTGGATLGAPANATLTVSANDDPGDLSFASASYRVSEGVGIARISVVRTGGSNGAISARCDTADGSAVAGSDYTATTDLLSWADGDTAAKICTVPILDNDGVAEGDETVQLALTQITGGAGAGVPSMATLTIFEDLFSDGLESGTTDEWASAFGLVRSASLRTLPDRDITCPLVASPSTAEGSGSIRLRTESTLPVILMLASDDGAMVLDVDVELVGGEVVEIHDVPWGSYALGFATDGENPEFWTVELDAATPCVSIDLER